MDDVQENLSNLKFNEEGEADNNMHGDDDDFRIQKDNTYCSALSSGGNINPEYKKRIEEKYNYIAKYDCDSPISSLITNFWFWEIYEQKIKELHSSRKDPFYVKSESLTGKKNIAKNFLDMFYLLLDKELLIPVEDCVNQDFFVIPDLSEYDDSLWLLDKMALFFFEVELVVEYEFHIAKNTSQGRFDTDSETGTCFMNVLKDARETQLLIMTESQRLTDKACEVIVNYINGVEFISAFLNYYRQKWYEGSRDEATLYSDELFRIKYNVQNCVRNFKENGCVEQTNYKNIFAYEGNLFSFG